MGLFLLLEGGLVVAHICVGASLVVNEFILKEFLVYSSILFCVLDLLLVLPMHF